MNRLSRDILCMVIGTAVCLFVLLAIDGRTTMANTSEQEVKPQAVLPVAPEWSGALSDLESDDANRRAVASRTLSMEHDRYVARLIEIAQNPKSNGQRYAIGMLAQLTNRHSIPVLLDNIDVFMNGVRTKISQYNGYPCAEALSQSHVSLAREILAYVRRPYSPAYRGKYLVERRPRTRTVSDAAMHLYAWLFIADIGDEEGLQRAREEARKRPSNIHLARFLTAVEDVTIRRREHLMGPRPDPVPNQ